MKSESIVITTKMLRDAVGTSSNNAKQWFEERTEKKSRELFKKKGKLGDNGTGAVYVYLDNKGRAFYVGQTSRKVKARMHDQTSPHKMQQWWPRWTHIRFIQLTDDMDRLTLEFLLILAYAPKYNYKPKAKDINDLFSEREDG
jgi:hypothetical protein